MDATQAVLEHLDRIHRLDRAATPAKDLLEEVHGLLRAAERWARAEHDDRLEATLERCREALAAGATQGATVAPAPNPPVDRFDHAR